jgi:hypothetical protein
MRAPGYAKHTPQVERVFDRPKSHRRGDSTRMLKWRALDLLNERVLFGQNQESLSLLEEWVRELSLQGID